MPLKGKTAARQAGMFSKKVHWSLQNETREQLKANRLLHCLPEALPERCSKPPSHHGSRKEQLQGRLKWRRAGEPRRLPCSPGSQPDMLWLQ